jgi:hypothetical protein
MPDSLHEFRAKFPEKGDQQQWIATLRETSSLADIAQICDCSERTIRDWQREKFLMNYAALEKLCRQNHLPFPIVTAVHKYAHAKAAGKKGFDATVRLYKQIPKNEVKRKEKWQEWWDTTGKHRKTPILEAKLIHTPRKSAQLAEFIGIMMGDGSLTPYQATVTLHLHDDRAYSLYVRTLMESLFHTAPNIYERPKESVRTIVIPRKALVDYLHSLGLPIGNKVKQQFSVPSWILENKKYVRACTRGLMDTDGSVFNHRYMSNGKQYSYKKISFTSASGPLRLNMLYMLTLFGISAGISGRNVRIDSVASTERYFKLIGSHNPKHLKRWAK